MTKKILVFVPGIMGSTLFYDLPTNGVITRKYLWSENVYESLSTLSKNPSLFKWDGNSNISVGPPLNFIKIPFIFYKSDLYYSIINTLKGFSNYDFDVFVYDWRKDIQYIGRDLNKWCKEKYGVENNALNKQNETDEIKFSFVAHSMGGLIVSQALLTGAINPKNVEKFITIGTPFKGSPNAFRALFDTGYLKGLDILELALNFRRNRRECHKILLEATQSFTSIYELLPCKEDSYIELNNHELTNPLAANINHYLPDPSKIASTTAFHENIKQISEFIRNNSQIKYLCIMGEGTKTEWLYSADYSHSSKYHRIVTLHRTSGDGTVPSKSADNDFPTDNIKRIASPEHMTMCSDRRVLDIVSLFLN